jgi:hypothetical protein
MKKLFQSICICSWDYNLLIVGRSLFVGATCFFFLTILSIPVTKNKKSQHKMLAFKFKDLCS